MFVNENKTRSGYLQCPLCDAEVPLDDNEKPGDQVYCTFCQCPLRVREKSDKVYLDDDF